MQNRAKKTKAAAFQKITDDKARAFMGDIFARWNPDVRAADETDESTINMYDVIGENFWTGGGITAKTVSSTLRANKGKAVTVNINSPGGDFFEGLAIYNLLKEHDGEITVRIVGMAASAASVIAMAGDTVKVAEAGFVMIHNAWHVCVGNKNDMQDRANVLGQFDNSMIGVYSKKTGMDREEISSMMDAETWISGADAVEMGFATQLLDSDELIIEEDEQASYSSSLKEVDSILAKAGKTRSERRRLLKNLTSTPGATVENPATPGAGSKLVDAVSALTKTLAKI